jgi:hypothetical protein
MLWQETVEVLSWHVAVGNEKKLRKTSVMMVGTLAEIQTERLTNTSPKPHHSRNILGVAAFDFWYMHRSFMQRICNIQGRFLIRTRKF